LDVSFFLPSMSSGLQVSPLQLDKRRPTDQCFGAFYVVVLAVTLCVSVYSASNNNLDALQNPPKACSTNDDTSNSGASSGTNVTEVLAEIYPQMSNLGFAVLFSLIIGIIWMAALKSCAKPIVYATIVFKGVVLLALIVWMVSIGAPQVMIIILMAFLAVYCLLIFCWRNKINLTACLIEQSVAVVQTHPQIFFAAAFLMVLGAVVYAACITGLVFLLASGSWVQTVVEDSVTGRPTTECQWQISSSAYMGLLLISFCALWSWELFMALRFYVVSLTSGVWYFSNASLSAQDGSAASGRVRNPVMTATTLAFTKSFGSIALASLIMYICEQLRRMARQSARNNGILGLVIACCIQCIIAYIEFLTRFALTFHALTGDDFCTSARTFTTHLSRHGFTALWVDWLSRFVFQFGAFVLSLVVTGLCLAIMSQTLPHPVQWEAMLVLGLLSFLIAVFFLAFIGGILLNVIDACYACLVLDLDHGAQHQPQIAQAIIVMANPTYVVEQPNGQLMMGQSVQPTHAVAQPVAVAYAQPAYVAR